MCLWNDSFLSKMNPKYLHESLGRSMGPPRGERSKGGGLNTP
ncbi:hypothetical protein Ac2012v2_8342 [Leucoagaricus gongylophorus]